MTAPEQEHASAELADSVETIIALDRVGVAYPTGGLFSREQYWALKDVSLTLKRGETLGVLGRNGAGKSTLLKLLAGIIAPDSGSLSREKRLSVALLALQVGFVPELSGRENAILSCILQGMTRKKAISRIDAIFANAEIEAAIDKPVATYSAGMRARLGFGVTIETDPDVILVDEVLGVGDMEFRRKSRLIMLERIQSDKSVVIVSHDMNTLSELCDRLVYIRDGVSVLDGPVDKVIECYRADVQARRGP